jgi:hypothetical protein
MHWVARPKQGNALIADKGFVTPVACRGRAVARACCPRQSSLTGIAFTKPHYVDATVGGQQQPRRLSRGGAWQFAMIKPHQ